MTSLQQRAELHRQIWAIANEVRGAVDGWDFKQYVLGALFYRFISENFSSYIEAGDESVNYAALPDSVITDDIKDRLCPSGFSIRTTVNNLVDTTVDDSARTHRTGLDRNIKHGPL